MSEPTDDEIDDMLLLAPALEADIHVALVEAMKHGYRLGSSKRAEKAEAHVAELERIIQDALEYTDACDLIRLGLILSRANIGPTPDALASASESEEEKTP